MAKKKNNKEETQKSLDFFMGAHKPKGVKKKTEPEELASKQMKEESIGKTSSQNSKDEGQKEQQSSPKKKEPIKIPPKLYFKERELDFGMKEDNIELEILKRESVSSKYLRYLIKKGDIVENLDRGLLLDVDYDGGLNKAYCKFYDIDTQEIKIWIDTTNHQPYCISKLSKDKLENNIELTNYEGFNRLETVERTDLLRDITTEMTKIYGKTPTNIGGAGINIRNILNGEAWEADIRYHHNYIYDTGLIPGLVYKISNGKIEILKGDENKKAEEIEQVTHDFMALFKNEKPEMMDFAKRNVDIFLEPIPDVKRLALDIEVMIGEHDYKIPDPRQAKQEIISVSFVSNDGKKLVYVLERENFVFGPLHEKFPKDAKIYFFKDEKILLTETFRIMWEYPIIITFNGDNFDLNYMFHRANKLKIHKDLNPIRVKRGFGMMARAECELLKGVHFDVYNFFANRSISGYAFGGAYERNSLNAISLALLGREKYQHEEEIHEMDYSVLAWYNLKDSILTLELTTFNDSLTWNLIIILLRITKMPFHDLIRHQISAWVRNFFFFEHRQKNYLIPRRSELQELKQGGNSKSTIEGKSFQGAYVIPPTPGIHYDVVVMDFASLYPSIIKEYNLSYETIQCPHLDCTDNLLKGVPYHACTHKMGIFSYVVGFFRDIRVKFFKPKSDDKTIPSSLSNYYRTIQQALKVFINSSYGVFGSQNFPLFCLPVAESTTAIGRYSIKETIKKSEGMGVKVLYGDTDSVLLLNPSRNQLETISKWSKKELDLDLEEEKTYQFLALSERKKNYIGIYKDSKYIDMKGLVAKKKNTPNFIKKIFSQLIDILKDITNETEFKQARNRIIELVRENQKKIGKPDTFSLDDYAINISLQKSMDSYDKVIPQHVSAAKELEDVTKRQIQKGEVISFIKSRGKTGAKAIELAKLQDIDPKKYQELLRSALEQVLDALGITFEEIKGIKKMDAFF
ncbi:MAG: DNA-directed DNA polymerase I [Candidatus Lokiarchaeota archaeon]|nr:DNA-directed DNA polymerase I [Candidatus Lokiarchaeota archaeon]